MDKKFLVYLLLGDLIVAMLLGVLIALDVFGSWILWVGALGEVFVLVYANISTGKKIDNAYLFVLSLFNLLPAFILMMVPTQILIAIVVVIILLIRDRKKVEVVK